MDVLNLHKSHFRHHYNENYANPEYDPRISRPLDKLLHLNWYKFQLSDLKKSILNGNSKTAHEYFRRKVGEVKDIVREVGNLEEIIVKENLGLPLSFLGNERLQNFLGWLTEKGADRAEQLSLVYFTLFNAVRGFDPHRGIEFSTYCYRSFFKEINNLRRKIGAKIRLDHSKKLGDYEFESGKKIDAIDFANFREGRIGRSPLNEAIVRELLEKLSAEEYKIIQKRYFSGSKPWSHRQIGEELGVSHTFVIIKEKAALKRLADLLNS